MNRVKTMEETRKKHEKEYIVLVRFLKLAKNGKYAPIEETSIPYARMREETEVIENHGEDEYYYGIS